MGTIERRSDKRAKRSRVQNGLLIALYAVSVGTMAMAAPNTLQLLKYANPYLEKRLNPGQRMNQAMSRLVKRGFIRRVIISGKRYFELTPAGRKNAERLHAFASLNALGIKKKWDGRWRIVTFDVWQKQREARDRLRSMLKKIGFVQIQQSVWAYPYDCEELIVFIRTDLKLGKSVLYFVADGIEYDARLREIFELPASA